MSPDPLLDRTTTLIALLGEEEADDLELRAITEGLRASGVSPAKIADAFVRSIAPFIGRDRSDLRTWSVVNLLSAAVASVCGMLGLRALFMGMELDTQLFWAPLLALPAILIVLLVAAGRARLERTALAERATVAIAQALVKEEVPGPVAVEAATYIVGCDRSIVSGLLAEDPSLSKAKAALAIRVGTLSVGLRDTAFTRAARITVGPGLIIAWVIVSFWALYFHAIVDGAMVLGVK